MANYFQDPKDSFVPTPVYHPNFDALQSNMMVKQGQYDQGLAGVQSAHNSVLNAPLTKGGLMEERNQYLQVSQKQLENLSQVDLSIQGNQQKAKGVYSDFFNPEILADMGYTQKQTSNVDKFKSFQPDKDDKDGMYYADARNLSNMYSGMDKVRNAKVGDMSVYNVREFTPYIDVNKYLGKLVTDQKIAIEKVDSNGVVSYTRTNGPESLGNWSTIVASALTDGKFLNQFKDEALYTKENGLRLVKADVKSRTGRDIEDHEAWDVYARSTYAHNYTNAEKQLSDYNDNGIKLASAQAKWEKEHPYETIEMAKYDKAIEANEASKKYYGNLLKENDPKNPAFTKKLADFMSNPEGALYENARGEAIQNAAKFFSSNEKQSIPVKNEMYEATAKAQQLLFDNSIKLQEQKNKNAQNAVDVAKGQQDLANGYGTGGGASGTGKDAEGKNKADNEALYYTGRDATGASRYDPAEKFANEQSARFIDARNAFLNPTGIASMLETASAGTVSHEDVVQYTSALEGNVSPKYYTLRQKEASVKILKLIADKNLTVDPNNPDDVAGKISAVATDYFTNAPEKDKWTAKTYDIWTANKIANEKLLTYTNNNDAKEKLVVDLLAQSKVNSHLVVTHNGKKDIVNADDLSSDLNGLIRTEKIATSSFGLGQGVINFVKGSLIDYNHLIDLDTKNVNTKIDTKDLSKDYLNGKVTFDFPQTNDYHGKYTGIGMNSDFIGTGDPHEMIIHQQDKPDIIIHGAEQVNRLRHFEQKWGNSKEIATAVKAANTSVVMQLNGYGKDDAVMGKEFSIHMPDKLKDTDKAFRVIRQISEPGNWIVNEGNADIFKKTDNTLMAKIHSWGASTISEYMEPPTYFTNPNGVPSIKLSFKPLTDDEVAKMGISGIKTAKDLPQVLELPIAETTSPDLKDLKHTNDGMYTYGSVLNGHSIYANDLEKCLGLDFDFVPNRTSNPTSARITFRHKLMDATGALAPMDPVVMDVDFATYTPDQMMGKIHEALGVVIQKNTAMQKDVTAAKKLKDSQDEAQIELKRQYVINKNKTN